MNRGYLFKAATLSLSAGPRRAKGEHRDRPAGPSWHLIMAPCCRPAGWPSPGLGASARLVHSAQLAMVNAATSQGHCGLGPSPLPVRPRLHAAPGPGSGLAARPPERASDVPPRPQLGPTRLS